MKKLIQFFLIILIWTPLITGFIFYQAQTTACDTCDRIETNSMRNILCCLKFSKCCIPDTLDEYNAQIDAQSVVKEPEVKLLRTKQKSSSLKKKKKKRSSRKSKNQKKPQK